MGAGRQTCLSTAPSVADSAAAADGRCGAGQSLMDVYFIPVGPDRYELYCEHDDTPTKWSATHAEGLLCRTLRELQGGARPRGTTAAEWRKTASRRSRSWTERMKDRAMCWIAEKIAEQRLLWRLRNESELTLHYPDDMSAEDAARLRPRRAAARSRSPHEMGHHRRRAVRRVRRIVPRARAQRDCVLLRVPARRPLSIAAWAPGTR